VHAVTLGERRVVAVVKLNVARIERSLIPRPDHVFAKLLVVEHHRADEVGYLLLRRAAAVVVAEHLLLSLGRSGTERQPAAARRHQHQAGDSTWLRLRHRDRCRAAEAVTQKVKSLDPKSVKSLE